MKIDLSELEGINFLVLSEHSDRDADIPSDPFFFLNGAYCGRLHVGTLSVSVS